MFTSLQGCRMLAATFVMIYHMSGMIAFPKYFGISGPRTVFVWGDAGVFFFFVLSGFIVTFAHYDDVRAGRDLQSFVMKRGIRIYPSYWLVFGAVLAASAVMSGVMLPGTFAVARALTLTPMDPNVYGGTGAPILVVAWTLQYEVVFYLLFALCYVRVWLGLLAGLVFFTAYSIATSDHLSGSPLSYGALFVIGASIAAAIKSHWKLRFPSFVIALSIIGLCLAGSAEALGGGDALKLDRVLLYGLLFAALILGLVCLEQSRGMPKRLATFSVWGGGISYVLYLVHFPLLSAVFKIAVKLHAHGIVGALLASISAVALAWALADLVHRWFEMPLLLRLRPKRALAESADSTSLPSTGLV